MAQGRNKLEHDFDVQHKQIQQRLANAQLNSSNTKQSSVTFSAKDVDIHVELTDGSLNFMQNLHGDAMIANNDILLIDLISSGSLQMLERDEGHFKPHFHLDLPKVELDMHIHSNKAENSFHQPVDARIKADGNHLNILLRGCDLNLFAKKTVQDTAVDASKLNNLKSST